MLLFLLFCKVGSFSHRRMFLFDPDLSDKCMCYTFRLTLFFSLFFWLDDMNNLASSQSVVEPDLADQFVLSLGGGL